MGLWQSIGLRKTTIEVFPRVTEKTKVAEVETIMIRTANMIGNVSAAMTEVGIIAKAEEKERALTRTCVPRWRLVSSRRCSNSSLPIQLSVSEDFLLGRKGRMRIIFRTKRTPKYASMVMEAMKACALNLEPTPQTTLNGRPIWSKI